VKLPAVKHPSLLVAAMMLLSSVIVYIPFRHDLTLLYRYWDGPLYTYLAKTLYQIPADHPFVAYGLPQIYFASHLPLYPLLIRAFTIFTFGHYPAAMLLATLVSSVAAAVLFFRLLESQRLVAVPLWTSVLFCFFPPRWLIYHSVGATEPLFFCFIFAAFLAYYRGRFLILILAIAGASLTRIVGVLLIPAFFLAYMQKSEFKKAFALPLAALGLLAVFCFYYFQFGDFLAYFRWNGAQHPIFQLNAFKIFRRYAHESNFHSTELYWWTYILYALGMLVLWKRKELFFFCLLMFLFNACIFHLDLSRYMLPLAPFALLVAFDPILSLRVARWIIPLLVYLDYLYVWGYIPFNTASVESYNKLLSVLAK
jgi:hypothetical protein